jgi:hypothetical protein
MTSDEQHVKVVVQFDYHWRRVGGEGLWSICIGPNLYKIDNIPFFAYGLNDSDIVSAEARSPDENPIVQRVEQPGGHRTLRVFFDTEVEEARRTEILNRFRPLGVSWEGEDAIYFALDIPPR